MPYIRKLWLVEERDGNQWNVRAVRYSKADAKQYLLSMRDYASRLRVIAFVRVQDDEVDA